MDYPGRTRLTIMASPSSHPNPSGWDIAYKIFEKVWGSRHGKFAVACITAGVTLLSPPVWVTLLGLLGAREPTPEWVQQLLAAFLIVSGVLVFIIFEWRATGPVKSPTGPGFGIAIPEGMTFEDLIGALADNAKLNIVLDESFSEAYRTIVLKPKQLECKTLDELLRQIQPLGRSAPLPQYTVEQVGRHFFLKVVE